MSKQKWYIIKNTNTCEYWDGSSDTDCWTPNINFAYFFYDKNDAIHTKDVSWDKDKFNDDCQVIELCEDDESYQELKEENKQLQQHLAEKEKEVSQLKKDLEAECNSGFDWEGKARIAWDELEKKDKEIERLKQCVMSREQVEAIIKQETDNIKKQVIKDATPIIYKECCHQICEKIRDSISQEKLNIEYSDNATKRIINEIICKQFVEDRKSFIALIDQIEKGE